MPIHMERHLAGLAGMAQARRTAKPPGQSEYRRRLSASVRNAQNVQSFNALVSVGGTVTYNGSHVTTSAAARLVPGALIGDEQTLVTLTGIGDVPLAAVIVG